MLDSPLVSVITPVFNAEHYIADVIGSINLSTYSNLELILVNDGSTDKSMNQIIDAVRFLNCPYKIIEIPNGGEANAVNTGLQACNGIYISVVNADDPIEPELFDALVSALEGDTNLTVAYPDWNMIDQVGNKIRTIRTQEFSYRTLIGSFVCLPGPGALIRRSSLGNMQLRDVRFKYVSDYDLWLRLCLVGPFIRVPRVMANWRNHSAGATSTSKGKPQVEETLRVVEQFFERPNLPTNVLCLKNQALAHANYFAAVQSLYAKGIQGRKLIFKSFTYGFRREVDDVKNRRRFLIIAAILLNPLGRIVVKWTT